MKFGLRVKVDECYMMVIWPPIQDQDPDTLVRNCSVFELFVFICFQWELANELWFF